jgi:hypothetical protein
MADANQEATSLSIQSSFLTGGKDWLPRSHSRRTKEHGPRLVLVAVWRAATPPPPSPPRSRPNPIERARLYDRAQRPGMSYADVAAVFGVTREEVCQYVTLVRRLPDDIVDELASRDAHHTRRAPSLRNLLRIARMPSASMQRVAFSVLCNQGRDRTGSPTSSRPLR